MQEGNNGLQERGEIETQELTSVQQSATPALETTSHSEGSDQLENDGPAAEHGKGGQEGGGVMETQTVTNLDLEIGGGAGADTDAASDRDKDRDPFVTTFYERYDYIGKGKPRPVCGLSVPSLLSRVLWLLFLPPLVAYIIYLTDQVCCSCQSLAERPR